MSALSERIVAALDANKGVLLPAIQSLMEEAWNEGVEAGAKLEWAADAKEEAEFSNPYTASPPRVLSQQEVADFARRWDARVEEGSK